MALVAHADLVASSERFVRTWRLRLRRLFECTSNSTAGWVVWARAICSRRWPTRAGVMEASPDLTLVVAMTHFATADEHLEFVERQFAAFREFALRMRRLQPGIVVHAANSAATLRVRASHFDLVRCGIAIYGCDPMNEEPAVRGLGPALELSSYLAAAKLALAGESVSYGRRFIAERDTWIDDSDRIRRRHSPGADEQLRRSRRWHPLSAGGHRQHGQHHDRPRCRRRDERQRRRDHHRARRLRPPDRPGAREASRHDQLRGLVRHLEPRARVYHGDAP